MTRFLLSMKDCRGFRGQLLSDGVKERASNPAAWYAAAICAAGMLSSFTSSSVTTSLGLASSQVFISPSQSFSGPASYRAHDVWQRRGTPDSRCSWDCSRRTPAESCVEALKYWFPAAVNLFCSVRTKAESWAPRWRIEE